MSHLATSHMLHVRWRIFSSFIRHLRRNDKMKKGLKKRTGEGELWERELAPSPTEKYFFSAARNFQGIFGVIFPIFSPLPRKIFSHSFFTTKSLREQNVAKCPRRAATFALLFHCRRFCDRVPCHDFACINGRCYYCHLAPALTNNPTTVL